MNNRQAAELVCGTGTQDALPAQRLILFTRYPVAGRAKTRLIPALGAEGAARLQRRLALRAVRAAEALQCSGGAALEIHVSDADEARVRHWLGDRFQIRPQVEGDLGHRLAAAFDQSFRSGSKATAIIGSDCPELSAAVLCEAFARLRDWPVVFGPTKDGGYYLVGMRQPVPELFCGISWGSSSVLGESLRIIEQLGLRAALLPVLEDIDRPEDLSVWSRIVAAEESHLDSVSVIVPALNEGQGIGATVTSARDGLARQIIVVDGGSSDETSKRARENGAVVLASSPGRARQMNAGAVKAHGDVLLFLHGDTILPPGYSAAVLEYLKRPGIAAGAFRFGVAESFPGRRLLELGANLRSHWLQRPYGDQALFLRRSLFEELGGFADLPILEDYELVGRLKRQGRVALLPIAALTSGRRWRRLGLVRVSLINLWMIIGYHLGWPPTRLASFYRAQKT
ncbi:MAG TPA: TIGR04283 family arsenosugar biosynthesis glycosyltransferase, partial [Candidatus Sulfopaludibacter sp.]|nr:TIGR04283 family arsenosugar biosynthesis glycosyltransferase [Candidatus Sulfopaludibacter sp.]